MAYTGAVKGIVCTHELYIRRHFQELALFAVVSSFNRNATILIAFSSQLINLSPLYLGTEIFLSYVLFTQLVNC